MNWDKGYSAIYYAAIVDPNTWRDVGRFDITEGAVKKTDTELRESADVKCTQYPYEGEQWIRVWLDAYQDENTTHEALFTGLATSPTKVCKGILQTYSLACYSVLKPASDILLPRGWYAPIQTDGAKLVKDLLSVIPAPVEIEGEGPALEQPIIAEDGETNMSMADHILDAMNWRLRISGEGKVVICSLDPEPVATLDTMSYDIIEPVINLENDWYECPNVLRAIVDNLVAVAKDEDPNSRYSIPSRGREIWAQETDCNLNKDEPLSEYAIRRLKELQQVGTTLSYDRRYDPRIVPTDFVRIKVPHLSIDGTYLVTSQSIEFGYGARTSEEVMRL